MARPADPAERLRGLVLSSEALCAAAAAQGQPSDTAAAQTALLQLHSLLSVTAAAEPASRHAADGLLQQCTARLHGLTMQRHRSEARRSRVAELLRQAGCPEGFRFANPDCFDLGAKLRQSEPYKSLLGGPLPSRRVPPAPAQPPHQPRQQQAAQRPPAPGVLAEQPPNQAPGQRRSGFQVPAKPAGRESGGTGLDAFRPQARQPPPPYPVAQQPAQPVGRPAAAAPQDGRWGQESRWGAKLPRRAADTHVHQSRQRGSSGEEDAPQGSSGDDGGEEERGCGIPGFQTARARLAADMAKRGQDYGGGAGGGGGMGPPPRAGLVRPGGGSRPAGLRKTGGGGASAGGAGGKFVPPYVRKALEAQNGNGDGEAAEGPLSERTLSILKLAPGELLPEALGKLDPQLIENVCNDVMDSGGQLDWSDIAGQEPAKRLIEEVVVWPMKNPDLFTGARAPPKGILMFGPPGTGKTMLGKAIATNISAVFFSISASSLVSKWMGEGERLVRALFAVAAHVAPSVIFIDEVDSLLSARKSDGEHESMRRLKTEILVQMEGIDPSRADRRVLLIGATNRPEELDEAARRRMPKQLYIPLPDGPARLDMIQRQLGPGGPIKAQLSEADLAKVVARTEGYSGSDMKNLIQEACQGPLRDACKAHGADVSGLTAEALRPVVLRDFQAAVRAQKASVEPAEIERYEKYNEKHGAKLSSSMEEEAEEEDW